MNYWLLKSEPGTFSIGDLQHRPQQTEHWDGVRNYQARNYLRAMHAGDQAFFYHSNCAAPGIVGTVSIARAAYPDHTALDPEGAYFDPRSTADQPRWFMIDVHHERTFRRTIGLRELKSCPELDGMPLLRKGSRLSVMPVTVAQWRFILTLE